MPLNRKWHWWNQLRLADQDIVADIESIGREYDSLKASGKKATDHIEKEIQEAESAINACVVELKRTFFVNRIFIRQTLSRVQVRLILITPRENLDSVWIALRKKWDSIDEDSRRHKTNNYIIQEIDKFFKSPAKGKSSEPAASLLRIRSHMQAIRKYVDDRILADLWSSYSLQRTATLFSWILFGLMGAIVYALLDERAPASGSKAISLCIADLIEMLLFGALGGTISAIMRPVPGTHQKRSSLLLTKFSYMRPLLGAVSGLFLFLLFASQVVNLPSLHYLGVYALAMVVGFSERALISMLSSAANRLNLDISRSIGQGDDAPQRLPKTGGDQSPEDK